MDKQTFDSIIIGSGQAGTPLAFRLAEEGQKVAFIEKGKFGGTCVNTGCTPTKTYVASARRAWAVRNSDDLGIHHDGNLKVDLSAIKRRKDKIISASSEGIEKGVLETENIHVFRGTARFISNKELEVNETRIQADEIYINVGGRPRIPDGFENLPILTNETILELETLPEHLIIVGGSYIGLEFAQIFRRFGSEVTVIERGERIIKHEDEDVSAEVQRFLEDEGIRFRLQADCLSGKTIGNSGIEVNVDCKLGGTPEIKGTHLLLATGRIPNTDLLDIENTEIKLDRGYVQANESLETNVSGIYALGDCNGRGAFTHTSYNDFEIIVHNRFEGKNRKASDRILTYNLYTDPPLGRVGVTKAQALKDGRKIKEAYIEMTNVSRAKEKGETNGFMRIIIDAESDKILGASILGTGGDEIVPSILNIMYADLPYTVIRDSVVAHPTVSELIPTMLGNLQPIN